MSGAYLTDFVTAGSGGLDTPILMTFTETDPITLAYTGATTGPTNVTLSANRASAASASITAANVIGAIVHDEPRIKVADAAMVEQEKFFTFTFTFTLSAAYDQLVTMSFRTAPPRRATATTSPSPAR